MKHESRSKTGQENNSVSIATENNEKLATMSRTVATGALDTVMHCISIYPIRYGR
jgi:hypothetical protein